MPVDAAARRQLQEVVARLEAGLKSRPEYRDGEEGARAIASWHRFGRDISTQLARDVSDRSRELLLTVPPMREVIHRGRVDFDPDTPALQGGRRRETVGMRLIEAAVRVRNNLFHGGKESVERERYPGHDQLVVEAAIETFTRALRLLETGFEKAR